MSKNKIILLVVTAVIATMIVSVLMEMNREHPNYKKQAPEKNSTIMKCGAGKCGTEPTMKCGGE